MAQEVDEELERLKKKKLEEIIENRKKSKFPDSPIRLTDSKFQETLEKYPIVVVDFWAEWCGPCKAMEPVISELARNYSGEIVFGKLNVDENKIIPNKFQISGIPTLIIFKDGKNVDRITGMAPKRKLKSHLDKYI